MSARNIDLSEEYTVIDKVDNDQDGDDDDAHYDHRFPCSSDECSMVFDTMIDSEQHYNTYHRYVCSRCDRCFSNNHRLEIHIEEQHDSYFAIMANNRPMFRCFVESCSKKFSKSIDRDEHCLNVHSCSTGDIDKRKKAISRQIPTVNNINVSTCVRPILTNIQFGNDDVSKSFDISSLRIPWHQRRRLSQLQKSSICCDNVLDSLPSSTMPITTCQDLRDALDCDI